MCHTIIFIMLFAMVFDPVQSTQSWVHKRYSNVANAIRVASRLINMSKSAYHDVGLRISEVNDMRFRYEKTPNYEQGYVFGELIERYKKMVEHYRQMILIKSSYVYDSLDRVEHMQKLYFEVHHLTMMMHEIVRKYKGATGDYKTVIEDEGEKQRLKDEKKAFAKAEKEREANAKWLILAQQQKKQKKVGGAGGVLVGLESKDKYSKHPSELGKTFPKRWPMEYGWEPTEWD